MTLTELAELLHTVEGGATVLLSSTTDPSTGRGRLYAVFTRGAREYQRVAHDEADLIEVVRRYAKGAPA